MKPAIEPEPLLTTRQVAAWLTRSRQFVLAHREELGAIDCGKGLRFSRSDVQAFLDGRQTRPQAAPVSTPTPLPTQPVLLARFGPINPVTKRPWSAAR